VKLVLLGTKGGPRLTPRRANPAQLIETGGRHFLVDCGEGTPHQVLRAGFQLESIESIFVTHHHSDHNAAYGNVLFGAWSGGLSRTTYAYGPPPLREMTDAFLRMNAYDIDTRVVDEGRPDLRGLIEVNEVDGPGVVVDDEHVGAWGGKRGKHVLVVRDPRTFSQQKRTPVRSFTAIWRCTCDFAYLSAPLRHAVRFER
jgi:glyoxylase-like metal-dependent hydrolase (beta-lactamase superfamily II)